MPGLRRAVGILDRRGHGHVTGLAAYSAVLLLAAQAMLATITVPAAGHESAPVEVHASIDATAHGAAGAAIELSEQPAVAQMTAAPEADMPSAPVADPSPSPVADAPSTPVAEATSTSVADAPAAPVVDAPATPVAETLAGPIADAPPPPAPEAPATPVQAPAPVKPLDLSPYGPGTIVVHTSERKLHLVLGGGEVVTYPVGVGKSGKAWSGTAYIRGKYIAPAWSPPKAVKREKPHLPNYIPGGVPSNPMGAAAMTLSVDQYAIHGTNVPSSIGTFASFGCIRMHNRDVLDLYKRVRVGTKVVVLK